MNTTININDFDKICRICLIIKENMIEISTREIIHMLEECTSVQESRDLKLPEHICLECSWQLKTAYDFKKQCNVSREILYSILRKEENCKENIKTELYEDFSTKTELYPYSEVETLLTEDTKENCIETKTEIINNEISKLNSEDSNDCEKYSDDEIQGGDDSSEEDEESNDEDESKHTEESDDNENHEGYDRKQRSLADILLKKYKIYGLTCNICHKEISTRSTLLRHMEIHDQNRALKYKCNLCNKGFYAEENLKKHINRHMGKTKLQCDLCPKRFYVLSALGVHYKSSHKIKPKRCTRCPLEFYHPLQLEQHEQTHDEKKLICDVCGKVFPKKNKLTRHKKNHTQDRPFTCSICNKCFKTKGSLQTHIKLRHEETDRREMCYICGKLVPVGTFTVHLETHKDRSVACPECDKVFANKIILERHIYHKHTDDGSATKFYCKICNKGLGSKGTLSTHMRITHSEAKKIECHICGKAYKLVSHVNVHIKSAHMDIRPHICQTCSKAFHSKSELKNHMRTHTGERPFPCHICGKAFGFKTVLKTHMKVHSK
ncbi:gastrula zinc finger protein XlCGF57.1-like [Chrysoperla carnea]|uniref:gastrula zinc finger protein XlCGF57.1-like n=1 Tax=Chrysoperla carnea TaxID=189513 RepID=UPI001D089E64|nr:gastrula zinc finger protein XlCGF57.1-like [Chrysoperla carnea]